MTTLPSKSRRIPALDVLRGIAILGTLGTNIWLFTSSIDGDVSAGVESFLMSFLTWLPNGKFLGLLTIMFGIGLEIQRQAALRAGRAWPGKYPIRAGLLFLDGLLNYVFVAQFDVLRAYAVTGLIVAFLLLTSERMQLWIAVGFIALHLVALPFVYNIGIAPPTGQEQRPLSAEEVAAFETTSPPGYVDNLRGAITDLGPNFLPPAEFPMIVLMGIASFLIGARLFRVGLFEASRRRLRLWMIGIGFGVALPVDYYLGHGLNEAWAGGYGRYFTALIVAFGVLALVAEFYQRREPGRIGRALALVGRMALSCYLLQNILGLVLQHTVFDPGYISGANPLHVTLAAYAMIAIILIAFAAVWLRRFSRGPFEMVWDWCYRALAGEPKRQLTAATSPGSGYGR